MGGHVSVCPDLKNELWKDLLTSNLGGWGWGVNQPASRRVQPWAQNSLLQENLLRVFLSYRGVTYLFENLRTRAKKSRERNFEFWGRAQNIGPWMGGYPPKKIFFGNLAFLHKIDPHYNWILRTFYVMRLFDLRPPWGPRPPPPNLGVFGNFGLWIFGINLTPLKI
jgi:hypothetical protein